MPLGLTWNRIIYLKNTIGINFAYSELDRRFTGVHLYVQLMFTSLHPMDLVNGWSFPSASDFIAMIAGTVSSVTNFKPAMFDYTCDSRDYLFLKEVLSDALIERKVPYLYFDYV